MAGQMESDSAGSTSSRSEVLSEVLGYLNFSGGNSDPNFQRNLNTLVAGLPPDCRATRLRDLLLDELTLLKANHAAFRDSDQAAQVIPLVLDKVLNGYREWHSDLLFHVSDADFEHPFFLARLFETVLSAGGPLSQTDEVVERSLSVLNDYLGYRPLAILENERQAEPYPHERHRPVPIYIRDAGVADGPWCPLIQRTMEFFTEAPPDLLEQAHFHLDYLDELAVDQRAHDHLHPVNKRTNYMFGEWDPHLIDSKGYYRRFVLRRIILDAMLEWLAEGEEGIRHDELLHDASAVLCGTILMASAVSGSGPDTYDSTVTLTSLLPQVARQRDTFYSRLLEAATGPRGDRLRGHAEATQQPFGHVRQKLNMYLARYGARQVQYRHIAGLYARMGYEPASREQARLIPAVSIRFECDIHCLLTSCRQHLRSGDVQKASDNLAEARELLQRGIECGALVDPWNILGFQGQFPLFTAREDAVPDVRVESLLELMERLFLVFSETLSEAAARGLDELRGSLAQQFRQLTEQWDQYATTTIKDLPRINGAESRESAEHVANALSEWRQAGEAAGDIAFWQRHVNEFQSARAYSVVVRSLLDRRDHVAAMGLLMQWLSVGSDVGLESGPHAIYPLMIDWMKLVFDSFEQESATDWTTIRRAFDYLEANAGEFGQVPQLDAWRKHSEDDDLPPVPPGDDQVEDDWFSADDDELYEAAYDDVVFQDSADDGTAGETLDDGYAPGNTEFEIICRKMEPRLRFLQTLSQLWQIAAAKIARSEWTGNNREGADDRTEVLTAWRDQVRGMQKGLRILLEDVRDYEVSTIPGDSESNIEFDIELQSKFYLLHAIVSTSVSFRESERLLQCCLNDGSASGRTEARIVDIYRAVFQQDHESVAKNLPPLKQHLARLQLLYVPLENGGSVVRMLRARALQRLMRFLLTQLPHMGLLHETLSLLRTAYDMERSSKPAGMAVTEFDRLFRTALTSSIEAIVASSRTWRSGKFTDEELVGFIHQLVDHYDELWTLHSATMRLSSVEGLQDAELAEEIRKFIRRYGADLFHPRMLTLGNVRAILHNGIDTFLEWLEQNRDPLRPNPLLDDLDSNELDPGDAAIYLQLVFECVVDRFDRFLEYNTTTTQSDYGEEFYCLLDFLCVEADYERDAWNLAAPRFAHEVLSRLGRHEAARLWERNLEKSCTKTADRHLEELGHLEQRYGIRLPTIRDHLNERFVKPLAVNRMKALLPQTVASSTNGVPDSESFDMLRGEINEYLESTFGSGIDVPGWLRTLESELDRVDAPVHGPYVPEEPDLSISVPMSRMNLRQMRQQLRLMAEKPRGRSRSGSRRKKS